MKPTPGISPSAPPRRAIASLRRPRKQTSIVLNTCTVRDNAERRAYGRMNHLNALKRVDPSLRLVVTGCLAEQDRDRMKKLAPHVDAIFGTRELAELGEQLVAWQPNFDDVDFSDDRALVTSLGGTGDAVTGAFSHLRAFVTVQRGCSYYCTFCIVPYVRGRFDHRPKSAILDETRERVAQGAREIVLVGQTVNAWSDPAAATTLAISRGRSQRCRASSGSASSRRIPRISPRRSSTISCSLEQLNPRIHLPLQSASDATFAAHEPQV